MNTSLLEQEAIYTGLLLGFSISIAISLISMKDPRKIVTATTVVFVVAAFLLFLDTYSSIRLLIEFSKYPSTPPADVMARLETAAQSVANFETLGFLGVIVGVGLSGWIHSKTMGTITTIGMIITLIMVYRFVALLVL